MKAIRPPTHQPLLSNSLPHFAQFPCAPATTTLVWYPDQNLTQNSTLWGGAAADNNVRTTGKWQPCLGANARHIGATGRKHRQADRSGYRTSKFPTVYRADKKSQCATLADWRPLIRADHSLRKRTLNVSDVARCQWRAPGRRQNKAGEPL